MSDDGHDPERHAREYWRQRFLEMRRSAPPCLGPAVDGVLWRRMRPGEDSEGKGPQTHVLSILEFTLKPSVDVHDGSRTPRKLWDAAFRYISSIPGCSAIEWASSLGGGTDPAGPTSILCLAHWENITAWRTFQYSLGFSPIIALLDADVSNRCARLGPLAAPGLALECGSSNNDNDARDHRSTVVDVVSVVMPAEDMSSPERRLAFEDAWKTLIASVTSNGHNSLQRSYAVWLENNAPTLADPTPEEAAAATKQAAFTAFLAWDGARYSSRPVEELCSRLRASLPSASLETDNEPAATVSRKAFQLINQSIPPPEVHLASRASLQPHAWGQTNLASILSAGFPRECSADLANLRERASQNHNRSLRDAKTSPYRFPAALGSFSSQGELFEGHMPVISRCQIRAAHLRGTDHCVDVAWIHLGACTDAQSQGPRIQSQLSDRLSALPGFIKVFWASDVAYDEKLAVLAGQSEHHVAEHFSTTTFLLTCGCLSIFSLEGPRCAGSRFTGLSADPGRGCHIVGPPGRAAAIPTPPHTSG